MQELKRQKRILLTELRDQWLEEEQRLLRHVQADEKTGEVLMLTRAAAIRDDLQPYNADKAQQFAENIDVVQSALRVWDASSNNLLSLWTLIEKLRAQKEAQTGTSVCNRTAYILTVDLAGPAEPDPSAALAALARAVPAITTTTMSPPITLSAAKQKQPHLPQAPPRLLPNLSKK